MAEDRAPVSVIIPTYKRQTALLKTLEMIGQCTPPPDEIIVHVDAGDAETAPVLLTAYPDLCVLSAAQSQGPGGARNRLLAACKHPVVVSLDDDSYPIDADFFLAAQSALAAHADAAVLAMTIIHDDEPMQDRAPQTADVADFVGCGCVYRRDAFDDTTGYLPLHPAYGMEEADIALQLLDKGWRIVLCRDLRVRHATNRAHQTSREIVAAHIRNTALLAYLRYPISEAVYGVLQVANRVVYSTKRGHFAGVLQGVIQIPATCIRYRAFRKPMAQAAIEHRRALRRQG